MSVPIATCSGAELFHDVIDVIEQRDDVAFPAEETRDAADAHVAARVADGADDVVGLAAEVPVNAAAVVWLATIGFAEALAASRLVCQPEWATSTMTPTRFISAMALRPKSLRPPSFGSPAAVAERVPAVVGHVHHADAELVEDADEPQFVAHALPLLRQRHAVGREVEAELAGLLRGLDVVGADGLEDVRPHPVGRVGETRQTPE